MKRFITLIITILLALPFTGSFKVIDADSHYSYACSADEFEVSYIENDGSLSKVSCHSSLSEAKKVMKTNEDYVVRYSLSYSPSKIVAMNSGLVYSYPGRGGSSTMYIIQNPKARDDSRYKTTYVASHYEMSYVDTCGSDIYDIKSNGKGYVQVVLNGFEGFADLEYCDLVPFKYINNNIPIWLGGKNTYSGENEFYCKVHQNYYKIEKNGNYYDLVYYHYKAYGTNGGDCLSYVDHVDNGSKYLSAGMLAGTKYYSNDGINYYSDNKLTHKIATVYNYYQFLPIRSKTNINASSFDSYIASNYSNSALSNKGQTFIDNQNKYGCNALIIYAMACLESAYGTSSYARNNNNLFGWSAYDDSPDDATVFSSIDKCVQEQMGRNLYWFADYTNKRYFGTCVGNKGAGFNVHYASDPDWGAKIAAIAYQIDKYANGKNGSLTDYDAYTIGLVDGTYNDVLYSSNVTWDANIYNNATGTSVLYTGRYGSHYQKDLTVIVLEQVGNRYKIQSTNAVENNAIVDRDGIIEYSWSKSVGYVNTSRVKLLNKTNVNVQEQNKEPTYEPLVSLRNIELTGNSLKLNGVGAIQGLSFANNENIKHEIIFTNLLDNSVAYSVVADNVDTNGFSNNDGFDYKYAGFDVAITLPNENLPKGSYKVKLKTTNGDRSVTTDLLTPLAEFRNLNAKNDDYMYHAFMNEYNEYHLYLDVIESAELDFTLINKPYARSSLSTLDRFELSDDGNLTLYGHAYIYYLNYDNINNLDYDVYLIDSKNNYLKLDTKLISDGINYQEMFNSKYNLNNISFVASTVDMEMNTFDLNGDYAIYLRIKNGEYIDICDFIDYGFEFNTVDNATNLVKLYKSKNRNKICLSAQIKSGD